jgi:septal ring factor EnvC (AmiA/AmiB activator)
MNNQQTAVEWLEEEINQQQKRYVELAKKDKSLKKGVDAILTATTLLKMKCEKAKEMEKQQIIDSHKNGAMFEMDSDIYALQYYNETYKKD